MTAPQDSTGAALLSFLSWAGQRAEINPSTAAAFASACRNVLAVEEDPDSVDLRKMDLDQLIERFENKNHTKLSSASLNTYKGRFRQSVTMFLAWLDKEPNWKASLKRRPASGNGSKKAATPSAPKAVKPAASPDAGPAEPETRAPERSVAPPAGLIRYQMPLRPDLLINLDLPIDLTAVDAARIANFVKSLAFAPVEATASGTAETTPLEE